MCRHASCLLKDRLFILKMDAGLNTPVGEGSELPYHGLFILKMDSGLNTPVGGGSELPCHGQGFWILD